MIKIGNKDGQYFSERLFENLLSIASDLKTSGCVKLHVWYDSYDDYHHCDGEFDNKKFSIQYYKIFVLRMHGHEYYLGQNRWIFPEIKKINQLLQGSEVYGQPTDVNPSRIGLSPNEWLD